MATGIDAQEDEKQQGESPQRRTPIRKERQGNAYHRGQSQHHAYIDEDMEQEY